MDHVVPRAAQILDRRARTGCKKKTSLGGQSPVDAFLRSCAGGPGAGPNLASPLTWIVGISGACSRQVEEQRSPQGRWKICPTLLDGELRMERSGSIRSDGQGDPSCFGFWVRTCIRRRGLCRES